MIKYLDPARLRVERAPDGLLRAEIDGDRCARRLEVIRAMPLSHPEHNIVLRDAGGAELGILEDLSAVPEPAQTLLREALQERYFLPRITRIKSVKERFGSSVWEVDTDRGPITIHTRALHEVLTEIGPGRYLLKDTEDNRYEIPNVAELDLESRERFAGKI